MAVIEELGITFFFLVVGIIAAFRLKLPAVIGVLLIGAAIGPNGLGILKQSETIDAFADIGATLLLFVIGIEFSLSKILKFGVRALLMSVAKVAFTFLLVYEVAIIFGLTALEAVVLGALFSITSTTIFSKLIKEQHIVSKENVTLLLAVLIIEDIFAVLVLAFISSLANTSTVNETEIIISMVKALAALVIAYIILERLIRRLFEYIARVETDETLLFTAFTIAAACAFIAHGIGLEPSIGAFLAGSIISGLPQFKKIEKMIVPFGLFFSSFFFLSIGMLTGIDTMLDNWLLILVLVTVISIATFSSISLSVFALEKNGKNAIGSALTMLAVGEFSLLIAKEASGFMSFDLVGLTSSVVFLTSICSGILVAYKARVQEMIMRLINAKTRHTGGRIAEYVRKIVAEVEPGGTLFSVYIQELKNLALYTAAYLILNGGLILFGTMLGEFGIAEETEGIAFIISTAIYGGLFILYALAIIRSVDKILSKTLMAFRKTESATVELNKKLLYDITALAVILGTFFIVPLVISILRLPSFFGHLSIIPLGVALFIFWGILKTLHKAIMKKEKPHYFQKTKYKSARIRI